MRRLRIFRSPSESMTSKVTLCPGRRKRNIPEDMASGSIAYSVDPSSESKVPVFVTES